MTLKKSEILRDFAQVLKGEGVRSSGDGGGGSGEDGTGRVGVFSLRASKELRVRISRA